MRSQKCSRCNQTVKSMLILACIHDLCLKCVADNRANIRLVNGENYFRCLVCKIHTLLDQDTVAEIDKAGAGGPALTSLPSEAVTHTVKRENSVTSRLPIFDATQIQSDSARKRTEQRLHKQSELFMSQKRPQSPHIPERRNMCKEHEQELNYYCFDCQKQCICSECVIHGEHKGHNVKLLKHGFPIIKSKAEGLIQRLRKNVAVSQEIRTELQVNLKELNRDKLQLKRGVAAKMKEIRDSLQDVEVQMNQTIDDWSIREVRTNEEAISAIEAAHQKNLQRMKYISESLSTQSEFQFSHRFAGMLPETEALFAVDYDKFRRTVTPLELAIDTEPAIERVHDLPLMIKDKSRAKDLMKKQ